MRYALLAENVKYFCIVPPEFFITEGAKQQQAHEQHWVSQGLVSEVHMMLARGLTSADWCQIHLCLLYVGTSRDQRGRGAGTREGGMQLKSGVRWGCVVGVRGVVGSRRFGQTPRHFCHNISGDLPTPTFANPLP